MIICLLIGFFIGTVGLSLLNCVCTIAETTTELIKAKISVHIVECNVTMNKLNRETEEDTVRAIGFATYDEEEDEDE